MDEFTKSLKAWLYDRASNPLFFVFLLSWTYWNFKLFVVVFTDGSIGEKLIWIERLLYEEGEERWWRLLWSPLITTGVWIALFPLLSNGVTLLFKLYENMFSSWRLSLEDKKPVDAAEVRMMRAHLVSLQTQFENVTSEKDAHIAKLNQTITTLESSIKHRANERSSSAEEFDELEQKILLTLKRLYDTQVEPVEFEEFRREIQGKTDVSRSQFDVAISKLESKMQLLHKNGNQDMGFTLVLSNKGKEVAIDLEAKALMAASGSSKRSGHQPS